jgi:hypothetical protein
MGDMGKWRKIMEPGGDQQFSLWTPVGGSRVALGARSMGRPIVVLDGEMEKHAACGALENF